MWIPRSAPFARASLMVCFARSGPIEIATTSPPCFSFRRSDSSSAKPSGSFVSNPMSDSRIHAPPSAMASGASFAGTCLTQTPIFKKASYDQYAIHHVKKKHARLRAAATNANQERVAAARSGAQMTLARRKRRQAATLQNSQQYRSSQSLKIRDAFVPPKPKEFDSA